MEFSAKAMTRLRPRKHPKTASLWETVPVVAAFYSLGFHTHLLTVHDGAKFVSGRMSKSAVCRV